MQFIGIDLHTNRFTCCYRDEGSSADKKLATYELDAGGLAEFRASLTADTYVLVEATITTLSFVRLFREEVKQVIIANTYELKQISGSRNNTDKIDAEKLCRTLKMQILSGEQLVSPVHVPPEQLQELRSLFTTYRLYKKQIAQIKNRIHSLLKEKLYGFTQEQIFEAKNRRMLPDLEVATVLSFQIRQLLERLESSEKEVQELKNMILLQGQPYIKEIDILTSMKGISVFIALAIIADIIDVRRFKNSKHFTSYLRSAPRVANSNTSVCVKGINKQGRKLGATLVCQALNHMLKASEKLNRWYRRLTEYKKAGLVRTGLRRRILAEIFQMLKKQEYHYARDQKNHEAKMAHFRKFLESQTFFEKSA